MKKKVSSKFKAEKVFQCKACLKEFSTTYSLKSHMFSHGLIPARYKCSYCSKAFFRSDEYSRHVSKHTMTQKQCYCDHCGRGFVDKRNLIQHLRIHDDYPAKSNRFTCEACGVDYCEERLLKYHIRKHHLNLTTSNPIYLTKNLNETWLEKLDGTKNYVQITKVKPTMLRIKKSTVKSEIVAKEWNEAKRDKKESETAKEWDDNEYYRKEEKNKQYNSISKVKSKTANKECNEKVRDKKEMFKHYFASVFGGKENNYYSRAICDYCNKEMLKKSILTHIRERHLKVRKFHCQECGRSFNRHYQLCLHNCGQIRRRRKVKKN